MHGGCPCGYTLLLVIFAMEKKIRKITYPRTKDVAKIENAKFKNVM